MNPLGWIQGLEGLTLTAVICGLLFLEECGLPIPVAPGDLVLAVAGIAIAGGRVNPLIMVVGVVVATLLGAGLGRELFALLGWQRLMKVADRLHARKPLERASEMLQRSGWRAVFTARLIPGLRVHTTQVAGVTGMPRMSFYRGLVPATAVYVAAFVGLGVAFGRPILQLIHDAEHQVLIALLVLLLAAGIVLLTRTRLQATLSALELAGWTGLRFQLESPRLFLIPACIGFNFAGHAIALGLKLPLFLDSIGTILCAVLAGPWVGGSVGLVTNLVSANTVDPIAAPYSVVSFSLGFAAGLGGYLSWQKQRSGWVSLWLVCFVIASVLSTPLNIATNAGRSGVPLGDAIYTFLTSAHLPSVLAAYVDEAAIDLPDKLLTVVAALLIYQGLPKHPAGTHAVKLDLGEEFSFIFRSRGWSRRILVAALCLLFAWLLLIPLLVLVGYSVAVARNARAGRDALPAWDHLLQKLRDGFLMTSVFVIWNAPGTLLSVFEGSGFEVISGLLGVIVLLVQPAIWSQYLAGGFWSTFNLVAIARRIQFHLGLSIVVGALGIVLSVIALSGAVGLLVGILLTIPYAAWVGAHLIGRYAALTDEAVEIAA